MRLFPEFGGLLRSEIEKITCTNHDRVAQERTAIGNELIHVRDATEKHKAGKLFRRNSLRT